MVSTTGPFKHTSTFHCIDPSLKPHAVTAKEMAFKKLYDNYWNWQKFRFDYFAPFGYSCNSIRVVITFESILVRKFGQKSNSIVYLNFWTDWFDDCERSTCAENQGRRQIYWGLGQKRVTCLYFFMRKCLFHGAPGSTYLVVSPLSKALQKTFCLYLSEITAFRPAS